MSDILIIVEKLLRVEMLIRINRNVDNKEICCDRIFFKTVNKNVES